MNFKKLSMASIGLAAFLFSCSCGGKVVLSREMMQSEIDANFSLDSLKEKYLDMTVKVVGSAKIEGSEPINYNETYNVSSIEGGETDSDPCYIEMEGTDLQVPVLNRAFFDSLPESTKFYKVGEGYSLSATEGDMIGDASFDKYFVCTSENGTQGSATTINLTFTFNKK